MIILSYDYSRISGYKLSENTKNIMFSHNYARMSGYQELEKANG